MEPEKFIKWIGIVAFLIGAVLILFGLIWEEGLKMETIGGVIVGFGLFSAIYFPRFMRKR